MASYGAPLDFVSTTEGDPMFAIEFFVGSARGKYVTGRRRFSTREAAAAVASADWQNEARHYTGVYLRRVVSA